MKLTFRRIWIQIHLVIGLTAGAVFVVMGLSGSVLVFYQGLDRWLNPQQLTASSGETWKPLDELVAAAQGAEPRRKGPAALEWPYDDRGALVFWFKEPATARQGQEAEWHEVDVDPYTGRVLGVRSYRGHLIGFLYEAHETLMAGAAGETLVAVTGLLLTVSLATGVYLWWPRFGRLSRAFTFQDRANAVQRQMDLHRLTGVVSLIVLMIVTLSGLCLIYREEIPGFLDDIVPVHQWPGEVNSISRPDTSPLSASRVVAIAEQRFPQSKLRWLDFPVDATDVFRVGLHNSQEMAGAGFSTSDRLWLNQYTGEILAERDWHTFTSTDKVLSAMLAFHNGQALGLVGRVAVCLAGLALPVLYVTALRTWWLKRRIHRKKSAISEGTGPVSSTASLSSAGSQVEPTSHPRS